jgi:hypothetical protein
MSDFDTLASNWLDLPVMGGKLAKKVANSGVNLAPE